MVSVNGVSSELRVLQSQSEDARSVNTTNAQQNVPVGQGAEPKQNVQFNKHVNAQDLDFSNFSRKEAELARSEAREVIQDLENQINRHNRKHPKNPVFIDFTEFPNPKNYDKKTNGSKSEAYKAWSDELRHWQMEETMRLDDAMDATAEELANRILLGQQKLANKIDTGRYEAYINAGITQYRIEELAQQVNYNFDQLEVLLNSEFQKTKQKVVSTGNRVVGRVNANTNRAAEGIDMRIENATNSIITNDKNNTELIINEINENQEEISRDGTQTREEIQNLGANVEQLQKEIMDKLNTMPDKKSLVKDFLKGTLRLPAETIKDCLTGDGLLGLGADVLGRILGIIKD